MARAIAARAIRAPSAEPSRKARYGAADSATGTWPPDAARPRRRLHSTASTLGGTLYGLTCLLYSTSAHFRASATCIFWVTTCSNMRASTLIR